MMLTVKHLKLLIQDLPDDSKVYFEWIRDEFILGCKEQGEFNGKDTEHSSYGWKTIDMTCDIGCPSIKTNGQWDDEKANLLCPECAHRRRYINGSGCFIRNGKVFIDGHY